MAAIGPGALRDFPITMDYIDGRVVISIQEFRDSVGGASPHDAEWRPVPCIVHQQLNGVSGHTVRLDQSTG